MVDDPSEPTEAPDPGTEVVQSQEKPEPPSSYTSPVLGPSGLEPSERRLAVYLEKRILNVVRQESTDPYGGLPADDVLHRLDTSFPDVNFPERMMSRLESEQKHRHSIERARSELETYEAESRRTFNSEDIALQSAEGKRAERVLYILVALGVILVLLGYEAAGTVLLGTTAVAVVGAFLRRTFRRN